MHQMTKTDTSNFPKGDRPKGRAKESGGLQATLEQLTGKTPCPDELRNAGNKYLRSTLFKETRRDRLSVKDKLASPGARTILMNALELDEVFCGKTQEVSAIVEGRIDRGVLISMIKDAESEIRRRFETYAYWNQRIGSLKSVLLDQKIDLKVERLDEKLDQIGVVSQTKSPVTFALRAVRQLEQVEQRGRLGLPTADECAEQADAYMALGDWGKAGNKAREAVDIDPQHARGWFLRVMAAIKLRNRAAQQAQRHRLTATEIAEPMSAHESMAYQMADEAAGEMPQHHEDLRQLLPQAIRHWPRRNQWSFDHPEQRVVVRNLWIDHAFSLVAPDNNMNRSAAAFYANGLAPEWQRRYDASEIPGYTPDVVDTKLPFSDIECDVLIQLFKEHDRYPFTFFDPFGSTFLVRDFQFLHLRWLLGDAGYEKHWTEWSRNCDSFPPSLFEDGILRNARLVSLWQMHQATHGGSTAVHETIARWASNTARNRNKQTSSKLLELYVGLYHHQWVRQEFDGCRATARQAQLLTGDSNTIGGCVPQPFEGCIGVPAQNRLYWDYLDALAVVESATAGMPLDDSAMSLLHDAQRHCAAFEKSEWCFWVFSEEYEGSGGEDYEVAPYNVDLRDRRVWLAAINEQIALKHSTADKREMQKVAQGFTEYLDTHPNLE